MSAVERESLNAAVSAVGHSQQRLFSTRVQPESVRSVQFPIAVPGLADLAQEFSGQRKAQHVARSVAVAHTKIAVWKERDICRHEVDRLLHVARVFARIAVHPRHFAFERGFYHVATVDVAMVEKLGRPFAAQLQSVGSAPELLAKGADESPFLVE